MRYLFDSTLNETRSYRSTADVSPPGHPTKSTVIVYLILDKHETKIKGMIYFQAIEDVFYDHLKSYKVSMELYHLFAFLLFTNEDSPDVAIKRFIQN